MEDFIYVKYNTLDKKECAEIIDYFEHMRSMGLVFNRQELKDGMPHHKKDEACFMFEPDVITFDKTHPISVMLIDRIKEGYMDYLKEYSILAESEQHGIYNIKIQKTEPGGGFHKWHFESNGRLASNRIIAYTLYLNDVKLGGETEFLYQKRRVNATEGTLVLFPANFTHTHRGNPPLSGTKYIITGWIEYFE